MASLLSQAAVRHTAQERDHRLPGQSGRKTQAEALQPARAQLPGSWDMRGYEREQYRAEDNSTAELIPSDESLSPLRQAGDRARV